MKYEDVVPATETGAIKGDGSGRRRFDSTPKPAARNVTTNAGRHHTGEALARVGTIRGGQSEPASNKGGGITGSRTAMRPTSGVPANQAKTSDDLMARLRDKATEPFTNELGAATLPTGRLDMSTLGIPYNVQAPVDAKPQSYGTPVGNTSEANYEAVGYTRAEIMAARGFREEHGAAGGPSGTRKQAGMPGTRNRNTSKSDNARMRQG